MNFALLSLTLKLDYRCSSPVNEDETPTFMGAWGGGGSFLFS